MDKIDRREFPASAAVHGGVYIDDTLRQFEERRFRDPDRGSRFEGTVEEIPPPGIGLLVPIRTIPKSSELTATEETVAVAFSGQATKKRQAERWWAGLSPKRRREFEQAFGKAKVA